MSNNLEAQKGLQKVTITDFSGGQVSADASDVLELNQGVSVKNAIINKKGQVSKRKGQKLFVNDVSNVAMRGIGRFEPDTTTSFLLVASGVEVLRTTPTGTNWTRVNTNFNSSAEKDTEFVQADKKVFIFNGFDETDFYDGTNWFAGTGSTASPPVATTGAWVRNYLFLAGDPDDPDVVSFSNNQNPEVFTVTDILPINTGDGQRVVHLEPYRLNEVISYKERSIYVIKITGTNTDDWTVQPISRAIGCIAPRSVVSLGNDQWFLSGNPIAVRSLVRTEFDTILIDLVSRPIQDIFDGTGDVAINVSNIDLACAILFDNKYILAIPTGTSTTNNTVVIFDFITGSWYVIDGWEPVAWQVFNNKLYYIDALDGRVVEVFTGTTGDIVQGPTDASGITSAISFEFISKAVNFDNPEVFKRLDSLESEFETTGTFNATLAINLDNEGWQTVGTIDLSGNVVTLPVDLPFTLTAGGIARKTFHLQKFGEFKEIQVRVQQNELSETNILKRLSLFSDPKKWRREN